MSDPVHDYLAEIGRKGGAAGRGPAEALVYFRRGHGMKTAEEIERGLAQFTGTAEYRRFPGQPLLATDGAAWLTDSAECYWLALLIAYSPHLGETAAPFQIWTADPQPDGSVAVEMREDTGAPALYSRRVRVHRAPPCPLKMWAIYDGGARCHVLMVPSEY